MTVVVPSKGEPRNPLVCSSERDQGIGLCISPLPVAFCGPTAWTLRELIN